jgi:hypothetical protein
MGVDLLSNGGGSGEGADFEMAGEVSDTTRPQPSLNTKKRRPTKNFEFWKELLTGG